MEAKKKKSMLVKDYGNKYDFSLKEKCPFKVILLLDYRRGIMGREAIKDIFAL